MKSQLIPKPSKLSDIKTHKGETVLAVNVDFEAYRRMLDNRAVKKNCTVPCWLNERAERANINFSATLQKGLKQELGLPLNYDPSFRQRKRII